jgi:hypothetical protein
MTPAGGGDITPAAEPPYDLAAGRARPLSEGAPRRGPSGGLLMLSTGKEGT